MNNRMEYDKGDVYDIFEEKSKPFDDVIKELNDSGIGEDFLLSLVMGSVGGGGKGIKKMSELFKRFDLAKKYQEGIPAYLRQAPKEVKPKGFRKVGMTEGKATPNDPLFEALKKFDSKGEKIPPSRTIDFLLDK